MAMGRTQKIAVTCLWAVLVIGMTAMVASGLWMTADKTEVQGKATAAAAPAELPVLFAAPSFALKDQDGQAFGDQDLRGKPYVAAFIFTHCAGICPMMSGKMAKLQKAIPDSRVKLVSFTVDPERDTPEVLKEYGKKLGAEEGRWYFLTGTPQQMNGVVAGMKVASGDSPLNHSERFVLVDGEGRVRATYLSSDEESMGKLTADAESLVGAGK